MPTVHPARSFVAPSGADKAPGAFTPRHGRVVAKHAFDMTAAIHVGPPIFSNSRQVSA